MVLCIGEDNGTHLGIIGQPVKTIAAFVCSLLMKVDALASASVFLMLSSISLLLFSPKAFSTVDLTARILDAVADRLLVNIQSDPIHKVHEEPPWVNSESAPSLSSVLVHQALLTTLHSNNTSRIAPCNPGR